MLDATKTTCDWQANPTDICVLPISSVEQHGAHLPVLTDVIFGDYFGALIADGLNAALLPTLPYGTCLEHSAFRGSFTLRPETLMQIVRDLADAAEQQGFRYLVLVNSHGGNFCIGPVARDINRLNRELEVNRQLADATRAGKVDAYRDEQQLQDTYDRITHEMGLNTVARTEDRKRFVQSLEQQTTMEGLQLDYATRRAEIINRLDEQKLTHQSEIADAMQKIELRRAEFAEDMRQQRERFQESQGQQVHQSKTDLEVAKQGIDALKLVKQAKLEAREKEEKLELELEAGRLQLRGNASLQALLATLEGEKADRILKLAELEMRKGLSVEQAMAMVAEKSPEIAPAIAEAMRAKYTQGRDPGPDARA